MSEKRPNAEVIEIERETEAPEVARQRRDLVQRARRMFGPQLAEAIVSQNPEPTELIGLSTRAAMLPLSELTPLMNALDVADLLSTVVGPPTIQAWFIGLNPELDDRVPAEVIVYEPEAVMLAARRFVANG